MILTNDMIKDYFSPRNNHANKGTFGKVTIIAGSKQYIGASYITDLAYGAFRMGPGYCLLAIPEELYNAFALRAPEIPLMLMPSINGCMKFNNQMLDTIMNQSRVITIGMGMQTNEYTKQIVEYLIQNFSGKLILDADAINVLENNTNILLNKKGEIFLTPHLKEFSRLTNTTIKDIQQDKYQLANEFVNKYDVTLILKDYETLIINIKDYYLNKIGCVGLAKAGSGDVLSGVITGALANSKDDFVTCCIATHIFGLAGEITMKEMSQETMISTDVINHLKDAISIYKK